MAQAYTPGLKVSSRLRHRVRRLLPISGDVLVKQGDRVNAEDVVAQTFMPGDVVPINLSNVLSVPPGDVKECMLVKVGDEIAVDQPIARSKGLFGFFKSEYKSKSAGTLETVSDVTGQAIIRGAPLPVQVLAFLGGEVTEVLPGEGVVIEEDVSYVQGIFGIGGEAYGTLRPACAAPGDDLTPDKILPDMRGQIVVGGARMTGDAIRKVIEVGVAAVISGGMDDQDLKEILGYDLGVAVTGSEKVGATVIVTEGFGDIAMAERTFNLLKTRAGDLCAVNGATQIRAGVMRPEIVIPVTSDASQTTPAEQVAGMLEVGSPVRVIRDPYFGQLGSVSNLPPEPQTLGSGSKARVLEVKLSNGEDVTVPRANVELIET